MQCEILSIGSELTSGRNLDTNSQWLSQRLSEMGIAVGWHTTIADHFDNNVKAFRIAAQRAKLVLATGGLGPTQDDLTREVLAKVADVELEFDETSFAQIQAMFRKRQREMPERNRVQAMFPKSAEPIANENGTAPGVWMPIGDSIVVAMPGVPVEMYAMFETKVRPRLMAMGLAGGILTQRKINAFGMGEASVEELLFDLTRRDHVPEVGITASEATISLRILARADNLDDAQAQIAPIEATIRERLGSLVYGVETEELGEVVGRMLEERHRTLSVAEGVTGGLVAERLSAVPGASGWFRGGITAYDRRTKVELLGVPETLIAKKGTISAEVAEAMAIACRTRMQTDFAVAMVGVAGPGDLSAELPAGLVYAGLAWEGGSRSVSSSWSGTREQIRIRSAKMAINLVRLHLLEE